MDVFALISFNPFDLSDFECACDTSRAEAEEDGSLQDRIEGDLEDPACLSDRFLEEEVYIFGAKLSELRRGIRPEQPLNRKRRFLRAEQTLSFHLRDHITRWQEENGLHRELFITIDPFLNIHDIRPPFHDIKHKFF